jgi:hypothetical protein
VRRQPLLRQTPLQERHARRDVGQPVDPAGDVLAGQDLAERAGKMVAVSMHLLQFGKNLSFLVTADAQNKLARLSKFFHRYCQTVETEGLYCNYRFTM